MSILARRSDSVIFRLAAISLKAFPEGVLEAHAGLVPPDDHRSFCIQRLLQAAIHETTPMICACGAGQLSQGNDRWVACSRRSVPATPLWGPVAGKLQVGASIAWASGAMLRAEHSLGSLGRGWSLAIEAGLDGAAQPKAVRLCPRCIQQELSMRFSLARRTDFRPRLLCIPANKSKSVAGVTILMTEPQPLMAG